MQEMKITNTLALVEEGSKRSEKLYYTNTYKPRNTTYNRGRGLIQSGCLPTTNGRLARIV